MKDTFYKKDLRLRPWNIDNSLALKDNKPFPKPMVTQLIDAYMRH